jgi:hypothetical protein
MLEIDIFFASPSSWWSATPTHTFIYFYPTFCNSLSFSPPLSLSPPPFIPPSLPPLSLVTQYLISRIFVPNFSDLFVVISLSYEFQFDIWRRNVMNRSK